VIEWNFAKLTGADRPKVHRHRCLYHPTSLGWQVRAGWFRWV